MALKKNKYIKKIYKIYLNLKDFCFQMAAPYNPNTLQCFDIKNGYFYIQILFRDRFLKFRFEK